MIYCQDNRLVILRTRPENVDTVSYGKLNTIIPTEYVAKMQSLVDCTFSRGHDPKMDDLVKKIKTDTARRLNSCLLSHAPPSQPVVATMSIKLTRRSTEAGS